MCHSFLQTTLFHPTDTNLVATIAENKFMVFDIGKSEPTLSTNGVIDPKGKFIKVQ